jgi:GMP synthase (glutamine-hydrolysing)
MHESFEAPGAFEIWAKQHNFECTYTRFYQNDTLPSNVDGFDYLIVMGGPQCPETTEVECPHFHAKEEIEFIGKAIIKNKFVLGICLGAQLIGEALGAKFDHSPNREIGVFELDLTDKAKNDPIFSTFPERFLVGHWHGDMPGLTPTTEILATSKGCPRQIVRYTPRVYGFQCHFEFTLTSIEGMIKNCSNELQQYKSLPYIEDADTLRKQDYISMNNLLFRFLDYMQSQDKAKQT